MTEYVMIDRELIGKVSASLHDYKDGAEWGAFDLSALMELDDILAAPQQAAEPVVITLGKGDKLVADIFAHNSDGIVHKAGVGIFDPDPGTVYGVGVKDTRIDGLSITSDRRPLVLIWSDKHESLQVIVDELQESIAHLAGHPPAQPEQPAPVPTSEFERGALTAIALIIRCHDAESLAFDILNEMGLNGADCSELDECDKEDLSQLIGYRGAKLRGLTRPAAPDSIATCDWQEDSEGIWETSCGEAWVCTEGTPTENNMKYCHSCGKHLKEHRYAEPDGGAA